MLEIRNASVSRGKTKILESISFLPQPGKFYAIIGANGAGKSTLLKSIIGQYKLLSGTINLGPYILDPKKIGQWQKNIAFMPQDVHLDVELSAIEIVLLGKISNLGIHIDDTTLHAALSALETVGLLHLANRSVASLSGGQCQMVLFAQLLMRSSKLMLLDEPVSALDLKHQIRLLDILHQETQNRQCTTLAVLHDLNLVAQYADEVVVIGNGEIMAQGVPEVIMTTDFVEKTYGIHADVTIGTDGLPRITPLRGYFSKHFNKN